MKKAAVDALGALALLGAIAVPVRANLGETMSQIVARYGKPIGFSEASAKVPFGTLLFRAAGYELVIFLLDDREVGARVSKLDKSAFTDSEMQSIMASDTDGSPWTPFASADPTEIQWARRDQATVLYDKTKKMLIFTSPAMAQALHAAPVENAKSPGVSSGMVK